MKIHTQKKMSQLTNENEIENLLDNFVSIFQNNTEIAQYQQEELRKISFYLRICCDDCCWKSFVTHDCIRIFSGLLNDISQILVTTDSYGDVQERVYDSLKNLLEIIFELLKSSNEFVEIFLRYDMFKVILSFFKKHHLVEFLYIGYILIFTKIVGIFFILCRNIYYSNEKIEMDCKKTFEILSKARDKIEKLYKQEDRAVMRENRIFRTFLMSLGFLQEKFRLKKMENIQTMLHSNHYEILLDWPLIKFMFKSVSLDFMNFCTVEKLELRNEHGKIETEYVCDFLRKTFYSFNNKASFWGCWVVHTLVEFIKCLEVIFTRNDDLKLLAYEKFKFCFKSVILHGVDIEKIIFLDCLKKFMSTNEIERDIFDDEQLIEYLKDLLQKNKHSNDQMKLRLNTIIKYFIE